MENYKPFLKQGCIFGLVGGVCAFVCVREVVVKGVNTLCVKDNGLQSQKY